MYMYIPFTQLFCAVCVCRKDWAKHYLVQNLEVYSANPLLVFPTYYVGDEGWYSDTGQSNLQQSYHSTGNRVTIVLAPSYIP